MNNLNFDYQKNEDLLKFINESDHWLLFRICKDGLHIHCKKEDDISLIAIVCIERSDVWDMVKTAVHKFKKNKNK